LGWKDNLINVALLRRGRPSFAGCTGHGCGAAFDFVALLPDGEVHACRKFPSRIGSVCESGLDALYASPEAQRYRAGSQACRACRLRPSCGGCMAVTYGRGLMPLRDRDPDCFYLEGAFSAAGP
jgi:radical SAM protein with 4Fe4S-binding SPASM domain